MFLTFLFGFTERTEAACCIPGCKEPSASGVCLSGSLDGRDCGMIESCKTTPTSTSSSTAVVFPNPIGFTSVADLLNAILNNLMGIIVIIAIIFIVIGGILYMTSGGNETQITRAKKTWTGAVIGLAIALAAPTFLKEIQSILNSTGTGGSADNWVREALTIRQIAENVLNLLLSIVGIIAMIAMVIGGGTYLTAYGDQRKIDTAKMIITYAVIGIGVSLAALVIVRQVSALLGAGAA